MKLGIVMDPIEAISPKKDTSFAMMVEAQSRGLDCFYIRPNDIWWEDETVFAHLQPITVDDNSKNYFHLDEIVNHPITELDAILMRKDPPFDMHYIYLTYLLEHADSAGVRVINNPRSLRDANEKCFITHFPQCCPKTLVTSQIDLLLNFLEAHQHIIVKPLDGMGGKSIFQIKQDDPNQKVILETITKNASEFVMAQQFLDVHQYGDKRVLLVNGEPAPYALKRIPGAQDFRGNLASGAKSEVVELNERDRWICEQIAPTLKEKGLSFVGIDIIGEFMTEINVTSPTGVREIQDATDFSTCALLFDWIEAEIKK